MFASNGGLMYTSLSIVRPCKKADFMSVVLIIQFFMDVIDKIVLIAHLLTVGLSAWSLKLSSNPRATRYKIVLFFNT